ncbi:MAG: hypothetical protein ABR498_01525 [Candidatus Dormibacteria bacterium]
MTEAVWRGRPLEDVDDATLQRASTIARANNVSAQVARVYPDRLSEELDRTTRAGERFCTNLRGAMRLLRDASIDSVLVKCEPDSGFEYSNFDIVVGEERWRDAIAALSEWAVRESSHPLEPDKRLLHPRDGPAAHVHQHLSWFGVTVIRYDVLRTAAHRSDEGWFTPSDADALRCYVAHALYQNLCIDLAELVALRPLLRDETFSTARDAASDEGWGRSFDAAIHSLQHAVSRLDGGDDVPLPLAMPIGAGVLAGIEHGATLLRSRHALMGARELALRPALVLAKQRRIRRAGGGRRRRVLVGVSGPDGAGKTTLVAGITASRQSHGPTVRTYTYGCVICRTFGGRDDASVPPRVRPRKQRLHPLVDALELTLRLRLADVRARRDHDNGRTSRDEITVITDRSPLDALAKHDLPPSSLATRWFLRLANRYDRILCLDAPAATLAAQDGEHTEAQLEDQRARFARWSRLIPAAARVPAEGSNRAALADEVARSLHPTTL